MKVLGTTDEGYIVHIADEDMETMYPDTWIEVGEEYQLNTTPQSNFETVDHDALAEKYFDNMERLVANSDIQAKFYKIATSAAILELNAKGYVVLPNGDVHRA